MSKTIPHGAGRGRRLALVPAVAPLPARAGTKPTLRPPARLDVGQARRFIMEVDTTAAAANPLLAMFLLGRCVEHAQALLDVIDAAVAL